MTRRTFPGWRWASMFIVTVSLATFARAQQPAPAPTPDEPGPLERRAVEITPENPIPKRTAMFAALYPSDEPNRTLRGTVTLRITLDPEGRVAEARHHREAPSFIQNDDGSIVIGPPLPAPFVTAALDAVRRWQYERPAQAPISFYVMFAFAANAPAVVWETERPATTRPPDAERVRAEGIPLPAITRPVRVGGNVKAPTKIKDVKPIYPSDAMAAKIQGLVILEATIGVTGQVVDARVLRSVPQLDQAALDAVRQWEYTPTQLNGVPVPIIMSVTVNFTLGSPRPSR